MITEAMTDQRPVDDERTQPLADLEKPASNRVVIRQHPEHKLSQGLSHPPCRRRTRTGVFLYRGIHPLENHDATEQNLPPLG
ncbi:MAG: hypothetical protein D6723_03835 [Acidobacteria bacterium]|nr:MAG: hypothetical protein D6723_03835 [Acidobacteriota bacterium]